MAAIQQLVGEIRVDSSGVSKGVNEAQSGLDKLGSKAQSVGSSMKSAGKTMTKGVTAPLVAMGATAVHQAATFESAMQKSISIMGDVSEAERRDLEQTAREVAKSTTHSHEAAAESYYFLASAGLDATESIAAMPTVAAYAESANLDMATATDYATDIMSAFGYEAHELVQVTDVLTQAVSNHNTTAQGMGDAMSYVAPVANSLGISIEETAAAIGMFSDVGIKGSKAGTSLRGVLSSLADPTAKQADLLNELGVNVNDAQGNMLPLVDIIEQLENSGADTADVMALFGREAGPAMAALLQEGSGALRENTKALEEAEGATQSVADTQRDTLMGSLQILKSNVADLAIQFGSEMTPAIRAAADALSGISKVFGTIPSPMRKVIIAAAAIVAAIGPLLFIFGTLLTMVPSMIAGWGLLTGALSTVAGVLSTGLIPSLIAAASTIGSVLAPAIGILLGPIGLALGAIALLAAMWSTNFGNIRGHTMRVVKVLQEEFGPAIEWIRNVASRVFDLFGGEGTGAFAALSSAAEPLVEIIANGLIVAIRGLAAIMRVFVAGAVAAWQVLGPAITSVLEVVQAAIGEFMAWFGPIWDETMGPAMEEATKTWAVWSEIVDYTLTTIQENINAFLTWLAPYWNAYWAEFNAQFQVFMGEMRQIWDYVSGDLIAIAQFAWDFIASIVRGGLTIISGIMRTVAALLRADWATAWDIIHQTVVDVVSGIGAFVLEWGYRFVYRIGEIVLGVIDWFRQLGQELIWGSIIPDIFNGILTFVAGWASSFLAWAAGLVTSTVMHFVNMQLRIIATLNNLKNRALATLIVLKNRALTAIANLKAQAQARVLSMATNVLRTFTNLKTRAVEQAQKLKSRFVSVLANLKARAQQQIRTMVDNLVKIIRNKISSFKSAGKALIRGFTDGIKSLKNAPKNAAKKLVGKVRNLFPGSDAKEGPLSDISETGPALVETFAQGIESNIGRVERAARTIAEAARGELNTEAAMEIGVGAGGAGAIKKYIASISENYGWGRGGGRGDENIPRGADPSVQLKARELLRNVGGMSDEFVNSLTHAQAVFEAMTRGLMEVPEHFKKHINSLTPDWFGDEKKRRRRLGDVSGAAAPAKKVANVLDDIVKRRGEFDDAAARDALKELAMGERRELGSLLEDKGYFKKNYEAMRQMRNVIAGGKMSQQLYDALTRSGIYGELKRLVDTGISSRDPQKMVQHEDDSWAETSLWTDRGQKPPAGAEMRRMNDQGEWVAAGAYTQSRAMGTGSDENPDEVGRLVAHAVQETLAGSELDLDTNGDEFVEKATLKVKQERKRNVRKSARTTR